MWKWACWIDGEPTHTHKHSFRNLEIIDVNRQKKIRPENSKIYIVVDSRRRAPALLFAVHYDVNLQLKILISHSFLHLKLAL